MPSNEQESQQNEQLNMKRKLNGDEIKQIRKRGRPSFWSSIEENENLKKENYNQKLVITPQILVKKQRRLKANDRERNRMKNLNKMLQLLKSLLPFDFNSDSSMDDKLTKIETLKMATRYIETLTNLLNLTDNPTGSAACSSPSSTISSTSSSSLMQINNKEIKCEKIEDIDHQLYYHHISQSPSSSSAAAASLMSQYYCPNNFFQNQPYYPPFINGYNINDM